LDNPKKQAEKEDNHAECKPKKYKTSKNFKANEEVEDWMPEEAFKVAHEFRNKHAG